MVKVRLFVCCIVLLTVCIFYEPAMTTTKLPLVGWLKFLNWITQIDISGHKVRKTPGITVPSLTFLFFLFFSSIVFNSWLPQRSWRTWHCYELAGKLMVYANFKRISRWLAHTLVPLRVLREQMTEAPGVSLWVTRPILGDYWAARTTVISLWSSRRTYFRDCQHPPRNVKRQAGLFSGTAVEPAKRQCGLVVGVSSVV